MDTDEMYRRGAADAERDEPNPFYYQHYYPYRRGYDEARRKLRRPGIPTRARGAGALWMLLAASALLAGAWYYSARATPAAAPPPTAAALAPTPTDPPTRTPIFATATPAPTLTPTAVQAELKVGGEAIVAAAGLRARRDPAAKARVVATFRQGERVKIVDGPRDADGYTWWKLEGKAGTGWSAERTPQGEELLRPAGEG